MAAAAAEVAAVAAHGHHLGAGPIVFDGFVFDGADVDGREDAVAKIVEGTVAVDVGLAEAALAVRQFAAPQAQLALRGAVGMARLQFGFHQLVLAMIGDGVGAGGGFVCHGLGVGGELIDGKGACSTNYSLIDAVRA